MKMIDPQFNVVVCPLTKGFSHNFDGHVHICIVIMVKNDKNYKEIWCVVDCILWFSNAMQILIQNTKYIWYDDDDYDWKLQQRFSF